MASEKKVMLLVDDDSNVLEGLTAVFELRGWGVIAVPTGNAGMESIPEHKIDVVLLDIRLPDGSGLDVLKKIKSKYPTMKVIIVTALGYKDDIVEQALSLGAAGYVSKGSAAESIVDVVENVMATTEK